MSHQKRKIRLVLAAGWLLISSAASAETTTIYWARSGSPNAIRLGLDPPPAPTWMAGICHLQLDLHPRRQVRDPAPGRANLDHHPIGTPPSEQILQNRRLRTHRLEFVLARLAPVVARHALHLSKVNLLESSSPGLQKRHLGDPRDQPVDTWDNRSRICVKGIRLS